MIEKIKKIIDFIFVYYYSFLLCFVSLWLGYTLYTVGHHALAGVLFLLVALELIGVIFRLEKLRVIGLIGLNAIWAANVYIFIAGHHPSVELTFQFPLVILLIGVGISLRGRFDER